MRDLNDLYIFSQVVEHNGFTGAAQALGLTRSSISRRISLLEARLGVRLVRRTTRHFAITDLGREFHGHCAKMTEEANAAYEKIACARAVPSGLVRVSCSSIVAQLIIGPLIPEFAARYPEVRIALISPGPSRDGDADADLCIRIQQLPTESSGSVMRSLGPIRQALVASPRFLVHHGRPNSPADLTRLASLSCGPAQGPHVWNFLGQGGQAIRISHVPRLVADDMVVVCQAAVAGLGIALLPISTCLNEVQLEKLEVVLPQLRTPPCELQAVFQSRRGMLPAVRSFIDFLRAHCVKEVMDVHCDRHDGPQGVECGNFAAGQIAVRRGSTEAQGRADSKHEIHVP